jgi:hypothetical protein
LAGWRIFVSGSGFFLLVEAVLGWLVRTLSRRTFLGRLLAWVARWRLLRATLRRYGVGDKSLLVVT